MAIMKKIEKTFRRLQILKNFEDRFHYLQMPGLVGKETFGFDRYMNQLFYKSKRWREVRDYVIIRDQGCDLGMSDRQIFDKIIVHHMNPITIEDIEDDEPYLYDPDYLICVSDLTHKALHYGDINLIPKLPIERTINDTCPWK